MDKDIIVSSDVIKDILKTNEIVQSIKEEIKNHEISLEDKRSSLVNLQSSCNHEIIIKLAQTVCHDEYAEYDEYYYVCARCRHASTVVIGWFNDFSWPSSIIIDATKYKSIHNDGVFHDTKIAESKTNEVVEIIRKTISENPESNIQELKQLIEKQFE